MRTSLDFEQYLKTIISLMPLLFSLSLYLFDFVSLRVLAFIYLGFCIYCQIDCKTLLIYSPTKKTTQIISRCEKVLRQSFRPLFFFPQPLFQTSLAPFDFNDFWGTKSSLISYPQRVPSAETVIDWVVSSKEGLIQDFSQDNKSKLLIIIPGLTGSVNDGYIKEICYQALNQNYRPVVYNTRWLTKPVILPNKGPINPLNDFILTMDFLKLNYPHYQMFAIGTSHGANLITKYMGVAGERTNLLGAVSVGNYFHLYNSFKKCGAFWNFILARILQLALGKQKEYFKGLLDVDVERALQRNTYTTVAFDEFFTRKLLGYSSVEEYYREFGCEKVLGNIRKPMMFMQSADDPICHISVVPREKHKSNENLVFYLTPRGGHCAWIQGFFTPQIFFPKPALAFLEALDYEKNE